MTAAPTRAGALPLLALLVGALLALLAPAAAAHDVVTGSDPADGAALNAAPSRVSVTFDEAPQAGLSALTVVGPDGAHHEQGPVSADGNVVSVGVGPLGAAGRYEIGYRVLSDDGHPVSGSIAFTLATPAPASSPSAVPSPSPAATSTPDDGGGVPAWPFVVLAVVVVAGAVALTLRRRT